MITFYLLDILTLVLIKEVGCLCVYVFGAFESMGQGDIVLSVKTITNISLVLPIR